MWPPPSSLRSPVSAPVDTCQAGTIPKRIPVTIEIPSVNARTVTSMPVSASRGISAGARAISHDLAHHAIDDAAARAAEREHHRFGQQLTDDPRPVRAEREAHGNLAPPRGGAAEQQARGVGAGDGQHERHRADEDEQRLTHDAEELLAHRLNHDARFRRPRADGRAPDDSRAPRPRLAPAPRLRRPSDGRPRAGTRSGGSPTDPGSDRRRACAGYRARRRGATARAARRCWSLCR